MTEDSREIENTPSWEYFGSPHRFFKNDLCPQDVNLDRLQLDTNSYRDLLYGFCKLRKSIKFEFIHGNPSLKTVYCDPVLPAIKIIFDSPRIRDAFFDLVFKNNPREKMDYQATMGSKFDACRRINLLINMYFFEFVNDLLSVSQPDGFGLFPRIYSPWLTQSCYNIILMSKILVDEYKSRKLLWNGDKQPLVKHLEEFLSSPSKLPSEELLNVIWLKLGHQFVFDKELFLERVSMKFALHRAQFCDEIKHLLRYSEFPTSGPEFSPHNPAFGDKNYKVHAPLPPYQRFFPGGIRSDKFKGYKELLIEWSYRCENSPLPKVNIKYRLSGHRPFRKRRFDNDSNERVLKVPEKIIENDPIPDSPVVPIKREMLSPEFERKFKPENPDEQLSQCASSLEYMSFLTTKIKEEIEDTVEVIEIKQELPDETSEEENFEDNDEGIEQTLLFKSISNLISRNSNSENVNKYFSVKEKSGPLDTEDKKLFLTFLCENNFLWEITNPTLHEILCHFKFLGRTEPECYGNFISNLRFRRAAQLEQLFNMPKEWGLSFQIHEKLREILG